ncbi:MAG TPA: zinc-binding dehydrogenase [Propionibacteriaceae bacterium]|nr:zinc-binding dehydrogenase [Propionibacteriaceae bacterium]
MRQAMMRAASLVRSGVVEVRDFPIPQPGPHQVLVKMHYSSICGSDVHVIFDGFHNPDFLGRPGYPGHEGIGIVAESTHAEFPVGSPVLTVPFGQQGGCFAEYQAVNVAQTIALPAGSDLRRLLLAQQLGTTVFAMKKFLPVASPAPALAVVIGAGSAGLFFLQLLRARGVEVIISDLNRDRLEVANRLGAAQTVLEPDESVIEAARALTGGAGVDLVIEAAGYDATRAASVEAVRARGSVGFFGYPQVRGLAPFPVERSFRKELSMEWSNNTQAEPGLASFRTAVDLIQAGAIEVDHCLQSMYDLENAPAAVAAARAYGNGAAKIGLVLPASAG